MDFKGLYGDTKKKKENKHKIHEHSLPQDDPVYFTGSWSSFSGDS